MRHSKKGRKLGTSRSHTKAMKRNLVSALFLNDRIKTIEMRAKEIRPDVDKIITWAKRGDLHSRRLAIAYLDDSDLVAEIFEKVEQGMFKDRPGGYTRIMKLGNRKGDNAPMVIMEFVAEPVRFKKDSKTATKAKAADDSDSKSKKKAAPKKIEDTAEEVSADELDEAVEENVDEAAEAVDEAADAVEQAAEEDVPTDEVEEAAEAVEETANEVAAEAEEVAEAEETEAVEAEAPVEETADEEAADSAEADESADTDEAE